MGLQSLGFYVILAWLPTILQQRGFSADYAGWLLFAMQTISSLSGLAVPLLMHRGANPRRLAVMFTCVCLVAYVGLTVAPQWAFLWMLVVAPGTGGTFVLALSFIALRANGVREAVALSGMAQGLGYLLAASGPVVFGLLRDLTGVWTAGMIALLTVTAIQAMFGYLAGRDAKV
jgi:CP family cyanate transporter-like MFS transporter